MFPSQAMIAKPSPKANTINEMARYLYPCEFLFGTNTIIARIVVLLGFIKSYHSCSWHVPGLGENISI